MEGETFHLLVKHTYMKFVIMAKRDADDVDLTAGSLHMVSLERFVLERVLLGAPDKKALFLLGRFEDITGEENDKRAIVILAKRHFETETSKSSS